MFKNRDNRADHSKYRKINRRIVMIILAIAIILIVIEFRGSRYPGAPEANEIESIQFVEVIDDIAVKKSKIESRTEIEDFLNIVGQAKRDRDKESVSDFPNKTKFTTILMYFKSGGSNWRSIYEEDGNLYIDQPYDGIFKIEEDSLDLIHRIMESEDKEDIEIPIENLHKVNL